MAQKKTTASKAKNKKQNKTKQKESFLERYSKRLMLVYFALFLVFSIITFIDGTGDAWIAFRGGIFSFFGVGLYLLDLFLLIDGIIIALMNRLKRSFFFCALGASLLILSFSSLATVISTDLGAVDGFGEIFKASKDSAYDIPVHGISFSGGIIGGLLGGGALSLLGKAPSIAIFMILILVSVFLAFDISINSFGDAVAGGINKGKDRIDERKTVISDRRTENKTRRREVREIRTDEKKAEREKKQLDALVERRRKLEEKKAENEKKQNDLLAPPEPLSDDFLVEEFGPEILKYGDGKEKGDETETENDGAEEDVSEEELPFDEDESAEKGSDSEAPVSKTVTGRPITSVSSGEDASSTDEPFRVIKGKPLSTGEKNGVADDQEEPKVDPRKPKRVKKPEKPKQADDQSEKTETPRKNEEEKKKSAFEIKYLTPPIDCLNLPENVGGENTDQEMNETAKRLIETLKSFGVETRMVGASRGPSVTRYELQPGEGVRINKITNLADDIALNLASSGIRIEAPIPGKSAVGIEVPNKIRESVTLREIISSPEYEKGAKKSRLNVAIGKDIAGQVNCADLAKMPHLLVAGTTGSGKSVTMNDMIVSLLYNASPQQVKLLLIDPKQVEFSVYNGIPHLYVPVISDAKKASGALTWAVTEMERRYKLFSVCGVRDLASYNKHISENPDPDDIMHIEPQVVIFIDELADLMMVSPKEVEDAICRLAQKARAAGMHLVVATQRPSVDVVTGLIKANIPSRLALSVSSQVDSRTILDTAGAEKLLGNGDLLFNPLGVSKPIRIQGAFVSDDEIERIVDFLKEKAMPDYDSAVMEQIDKFAAEAGSKKGSSSDADEKPSPGEKVDALFDEVLRFACEAGEISGSLIMRKFSLGYGRSAKIIDQMTERGYLGEVNTSTKKRPVLISIDRYWEMKAAQESGSDDSGSGDDDSDSDDAAEKKMNSFDEPVDDDFDIFSDE